MSNIPKSGGEEWYIVFTDAKIDHWVYKFVDKSIGHVYAVKALNDYQWLIVQPRVNYTEIDLKSRETYTHIRQITGPDAKIVKVDAKCTSVPRGTLNWYNCVEQVKALIGIRSFWTWTPKQLYKGLMGNRYVRS
jgi:hypothetical protein